MAEISPEEQAEGQNRANQRAYRALAEGMSFDQLMPSDEKQRFDEYLSNNSPGPCANCGANDWVMSSTVTLPYHTYYNQPYVDSHGPMTPVAMLACKKCFSYRFFSAKACGVLPPFRSPLAPPPPSKPTNVQVRTSRGEQVAVADFTIAVGEEAVVTSEYGFPMRFQVSDTFKMELITPGDTPEVTWADECLVAVKGALVYPNFSTLVVSNEVTRAIQENVQFKFQVRIEVRLSAVQLQRHDEGVPVLFHVEQYFKAIDSDGTQTPPEAE